MEFEIKLIYRYINIINIVLHEKIWKIWNVDHFVNLKNNPKKFVKNLTCLWDKILNLAYY